MAPWAGLTREILKTTKWQLRRDSYLAIPPSLVLLIMLYVVGNTVKAPISAALTCTIDTS